MRAGIYLTNAPQPAKERHQKKTNVFIILFELSISDDEDISPRLLLANRQK